MFSLRYEQIDAIADSYIPLLVLAAIAILTASFRRDPATFRGQMALVFAGLVLAYGLMLIDTILTLWPRLGLDYSTHTAVSLVLVLFLVHALPRSLPWLSISWLLYGWVMVFQAYHSLADILSTALVIGPVFGALLLRGRSVSGWSRASG